MKITAIDSKRSTQSSALLVVEPKVPKKVYDFFSQGIDSDPNFGGLKIEYENGDLRVHQHVLPSGYPEFIETKLKQAESTIEHIEDVKKEKIEVEEELKTDSLTNLSKSTGIPLK